MNKRQRKHHHAHVAADQRARHARRRCLHVEDWLFFHGCITAAERDAYAFTQPTTRRTGFAFTSRHPTPVDTRFFQCRLAQERRNA